MRLGRVVWSRRGVFRAETAKATADDVARVLHERMNKIGEIAVEVFANASSGHDLKTRIISEDQLREIHKLAKGEQ